MPKEICDHCSKVATFIGCHHFDCARACDDHLPKLVYSNESGWFYHYERRDVPQINNIGLFFDSSCWCKGGSPHFRDVEWPKIKKKREEDMERFMKVYRKDCEK